MIDAIQFDEALQRIAPYVRHTPLLPMPTLRGEFHPQLTLTTDRAG